MGWGTATTAPSPRATDTQSWQEEGDGRGLWGWLVVGHRAMPQLITRGPMFEVSSGARRSDSAAFLLIYHGW